MSEEVNPDPGHKAILDTKLAVDEGKARVQKSSYDYQKDRVEQFTSKPRPGPEKSGVLRRPFKPYVDEGKARVQKSSYDYQKDRVEQFTSKPRPGPEKSGVWGRRFKSDDDHDDPRADLAMSQSVRVEQNLLDKVGGYDGLCKQLMRNETLREIKFDLKEVTADFSIFCDFLEVNKTVSSLAVQGIWIDPSAVAAFSEALKTNTTITSLTLYWGRSEPAAAAFSEALKTNTTITSLTLHGGWGKPSAAAAFSEALKTNTTITSLTLHWGWGKPSAAAAFSEALKWNTTITSLTLHWGWSGPSAAPAFSEALKRNTTITSLTLHGRWTEPAATAFSEAMKTNTTITSLTLLGKWSDLFATAAVFSNVIRKGLTITLNKDYSMVVGATDRSYPHCLWISEFKKTDDSGIAYKQEKGYSKALRNEEAKTCLEPLYIECSECSFELFTALRNECCQWSGVLCCEGFVLSTDYFTLAVRDEKLFYLHIGWHSNFIKIILETGTGSVSTELSETLSGGIRLYLETVLELLRTKLSNIANMRCVFKVKKREKSSKCNIHNLQGCLDENCIQLSPIGWGPEASSRNWSYRNEAKKGAPRPVDMFRLSLDLDRQWTTLGKLLGLAESVQTLLNQDKSDDKLRCFKMLMIWLKVGCSVTFETLGKALVDREMKRDDLFLKHCKEEKQLSKWFRITPQGGQVSYLGCTIDIPEGSIESEAELCLGFLKTGPPEGDCVAPVLHVETKPSTLCLKKPVAITLPVFVHPVELDEPLQPELTLMCFQEGLWKEVPSSKLRFCQTAFEVSHFSGWALVFKSFRFWFHKNMACYLFGKENPENYMLEMLMCVCANTEPEIKGLQEDYKGLGYVKLHVGGNNLVVSRGCDVVLSSCILKRNNAPTSADVTPQNKILKSANFESNVVRQVAHFEVNGMHSPTLTGTAVVCTAENGEKRAPFKSSTELKFYLKECVENEESFEKKKEGTSLGSVRGSSDETLEECVKNEKSYEKKEEGTSHGSLRGSSDETVEEKCSKEDVIIPEVQNTAESEMSPNLGENLKVVLLCSEWGSSKGGLSTFSRQLAINIAKRSDLKVSCFLPEVSESDRNAAIKDNVTLIEAEDIGATSDPLSNLQRWPKQLPSPDVIISHGLKFGFAADSIKYSYSSCKWVHFVHVNYEELKKYKRGSKEIAANSEKDSNELRWCRRADVVVAVGPQLFDRYSRSLSFERKKLKEFYPGLSDEFLSLPQKKIENIEFHVFMFARCSSENLELKGVYLLADAVGKLGKKYKVHVVGVPAEEEPETFQHILEVTAITKDQLYGREFCNDRERLKEMMREADLVVMSSRAEAFGLIGLEALSAAVPLLVSAQSGLGITLKKLNCGEICVVESDDSQVWAERIESVKDKERKQRITEMEQLRNRYDEKFKWEEQCSILAKLFRDECNDGQWKGPTS